MSDTDTPTDPAASDEPDVIEVEQTSNPDDVMVPGAHLPCGGVNFRRGMCRDGYLGRHTCTPPDEQSATEPAPAKRSTAKRSTAKRSA